VSVAYSQTATFSVADVETAFRRFRSDILMIADSTKAITRQQAEDYAHDAEYLAKRDYLRKVDVTLLNGNGAELRACCYTVNEQASDLVSSRPGGVLWPNVANARIRIVLSYTLKYTDAARQAAEPNLKINWVTSTADTSHAVLNSLGGRAYVSNAYGLQRKDFG